MPEQINEPTEPEMGESVGSTERPEALQLPDGVESIAPLRQPRALRRDSVVLEAEGIARDAAEEVALAGTVGEHLGASMAGERLALHKFACLDDGYPGWAWEVSVARAARSKTVTVCEVALIPGPDALLAPPWVPWRDRLEPGDMSRNDVLPFEANDPRLQCGFEQTNEDESADQRTIDQIGFGRPRVLSQQGIDDAAKRWYSSARGPVASTKSNEMCSNCGFLVKIAGSLGTLFGVCANAWSPDDASVVSLDHTCGAHSETDQPKRKPVWSIIPSRINDEAIELSKGI